jgi:hypothetical protein
MKAIGGMGDDAVQLLSFVGRAGDLRDASGEDADHASGAAGLAKCATVPVQCSYLYRYRKDTSWNPQTITALVLAERAATDRAGNDPHRQRRIDALRERDRSLAARVKADRWLRARASLARVIRRVAEAVEPPRPACVTAATDPC